MITKQGSKSFPVKVNPSADVNTIPSQDPARGATHQIVHFQGHY